MSLPQLMQKMSSAPAEILGLEGGALAEGATADFAIVDLNKKYVIDGNKFVSKGKNTPFNGFEVYGAVVYTVVDGKIKYKA